MSVAVVTGASRGIGREIASCLFEEGYQVAIHFHKNRELAENLAAQLNAQGKGNQAVAIGADISQKAQVEVLFCQVRQRLGPVDMLVNNAGIAQQKLFTDLTEADWDTMLGTNLSGVFYACQCALKDMIPRQAGKIINISSMWGQVGASCEVHYSAAKAGVIGLTKALAKELGPSHITVNCVTPGVIETEMNGNLDGETIEGLKEETPLGRLGTPRDVAEMVRFLASHQADFITGQVFGVNGGFVISG